jgi:hypothetical protein
MSFGRHFAWNLEQAVAYFAPPPWEAAEKLSRGKRIELNRAAPHARHHHAIGHLWVLHLPARACDANTWFDPLRRRRVLLV